MRVCMLATAASAVFWPSSAACTSSLKIAESSGALAQMPISFMSATPVASDQALKNGSFCTAGD